MSMMNCPRCKQPIEVSEGHAICNSCGTKFKLQTKSVPAASLPAAPPRPPQPAAVPRPIMAAALTSSPALIVDRGRYYTGQSSSSANKNFATRPAPTWNELTEPHGYLADPGLIDAVNVSLLLGQPLLLTGEAGTGKTQLAYSLAAELGLGEPLKFETKSTSESKDLFYNYDALARFQAAQTGAGSQRTSDYIRLNALGLAIFRANPPDRYAGVLSTDQLETQCARSVVLIDEVDKAPRDFPNDILSEIEGMYFRIAEMNHLTIRADPAFKPVVIMTSNSEKNLPDAFLRRCIFYSIPFPTADRIRQIVETRLTCVRGCDSKFLDDALQFFSLFRLSAGRLEKKPSTAELLAWIIALRQRAPDLPNPLKESKEFIAGSLCALVKTTADQQAATLLLEQWLAAQSANVKSKG